MGNDISINTDLMKGWNRTYQSLEEIPLKYNGKILQSIDCHSWVNHNGRIIDYPLHKLKEKSMFGTNKIVRKPFPKMLQVQVLPHIVKIWENNIKEMNETQPKFYHKTQKRYWNENAGNCFMKSIEYWKKHKHEGAMIIIGSLGFIQENVKDIYYDYG